MLKTGVEIADRFSLTRRLGGTDEAQVWEAFDRSRNSPVVLKVQRATAPGAGLEAQYNACVDLAHPGIARPIEFVRSGELACLAMHPAAAGDLGGRRGQSYRAFLPQAQPVARPMAILH